MVIIVEIDGWRKKINVPIDLIEREFLKVEVHHPISFLVRPEDLVPSEPVGTEVLFQRVGDRYFKYNP